MRYWPISVLGGRTTAEVTPVGEIDDLKFTVGDITQWMMEDYDKVVGKQESDAQSAAE